MTTKKIAFLQAEISKVQGERDRIASLIAERQQESAKIENEIAAVQADRDALTPRLEALLASEAVGEDVVAELAAVRATVASASKRLATARKRDSKALELHMAENGLVRHVADIDARLTILCNQVIQERADVVRAIADEKKSTYAAMALALADQFADVLAASDALLNITGKDPAIVPPESLRICLPGFVGQPPHLMTAGGFPKLKADGAKRVNSELVAAGVL